MAKRATKATAQKGAQLARRTKWRETFLRVLADTCNVRAAAQAAAVNRQTVYEHRDRDPGFAAAWDQAIEDAADVLEAEAWTRARAQSDLLLIFLLKARRPRLYRETVRQEMTGKDGGPVTIRVVYDEPKEGTGAESR